MANAARTAAACRIARLDRQKFNDLMASGEYTCAPRTSPGVPRVFELPDLIGLYLFTRLIERGRTVRQASDAACRVVTILRNEMECGKELSTHIMVAHGMMGSSFASSSENANPLGDQFVAGGDFNPIMLTEVWNVKNLRDAVERGLAEELRIVGGDD